MNKTINDFLDRNYDKDTIKYRINIFNEVREYKYQINNANSIEKILEIKEGYCVPKHRLLQEAYNILGYETQLCFIPFIFDNIAIPGTLRGRGLGSKQRYHTFLQMYIDNNRVSIDATFQSKLNGKFVTNTDRDGISDQNIICNYSQIYIPKSKEEEIEIKEKLTCGIIFPMILEVHKNLFGKSYCRYCHTIIYHFL